MRYYSFTIIAIIITLGAELFVKTAYNKYKKRLNKRGITGREAARIVLDKNGLTDVDIEETRGYLSDHYDPRTKVVRLSSSNYNGKSIASVAVACHECGHAIQDKNNFIFLRFRNAIIPIVNLSSKAGYFAILFGSIFSFTKLIYLGIIAELVILLFQVVTLQVEFDASRRGLKEIKNNKLLSKNEHGKGKTVLVAAAMTYVASVASAVLEILKLLLFMQDNED